MRARGAMQAASCKDYCNGDEAACLLGLRHRNRAMVPTPLAAHSLTRYSYSTPPLD
jgi:hypothetical protein